MIRPVLASRGSIGGVVAVAGGSPKWWLAGGAPTPVAAYQPKGAASLAASYVNLANPGTNDAAPGVAPTFNTAVGWTFNGSTQYLTTGVVPASGWAAIVRFSNVTSAAGVRALLGEGFTDASLAIFPRWTGGTGVQYYNGLSAGFLNKSPVLLGGVLAVSGNTAYRDGVTESGTMGAWTGSNTWGIYIGAYNVNGTTPSGFLACDIQAAAIYPSTLTAGMVAAVSAAMAAL